MKRDEIKEGKQSLALTPHPSLPAWLFLFSSELPLLCQSPILVQCSTSLANSIKVGETRERKARCCCQGTLLMLLDPEKFSTMNKRWGIPELQPALVRYPCLSLGLLRAVNNFYLPSAQAPPAPTLLFNSALS